MYDNEERCAMGLSVFQMSLVQADKHRIGFSAQAVNPVWSEGGREAGVLSTGMSCSNLAGQEGDISPSKRKAEM